MVDQEKQELFRLLKEKQRKLKELIELQENSILPYHEMFGFIFRDPFTELYDIIKRNIDSAKKIDPKVGIWIGMVPANFYFKTTIPLRQFNFQILNYVVKIDGKVHQYSYDAKNMIQTTELISPNQIKKISWKYTGGSNIEAESVLKTLYELYSRGEAYFSYCQKLNHQQILDVVSKYAIGFYTQEQIFNTRLEVPYHAIIQDRLARNPRLDRHFFPQNVH